MILIGGGSRSGKSREALKGIVSVVESMRSGPVRSREVASVTADQVPSVLVVAVTAVAVLVAV